MIADVPTPEFADAVRCQRERLRAELVAGAVSPIDVLREPPAWMDTAVLGDVLCWAGLDEATCVQVLDACGLNWGRRMEQLKPREVWRVFVVVGAMQPLAWRRWRRAQRPAVAA